MENRRIRMKKNERMNEKKNKNEEKDRRENSPNKCKRYFLFINFKMCGTTYIYRTQVNYPYIQTH